MLVITDRFTAKGVLKKGYSPYPGPLFPNDLTDDEAESIYFGVRWPLDSPSCTKCGRALTFNDLREKRHCSCGHRNYLLMGTCLTHCQLSLWKAFRIVYNNRVLKLKPTRIAEVGDIPIDTVKRVLAKFPPIGKKHNEEHRLTLDLVYSTMAAWKDYRREKRNKMKEGKKCTGEFHDPLVGSRDGVHQGSQEAARG